MATSHSFDTRLAKEYGLEEAILLNNFYFWLEKNAKNNRNLHDGEYWTYNSIKAFEEQFPYITTNKLRRAISNLIDKKLIKKGNFNQNPYDRTAWYALDTAGYALFNITPAFVELTNDSCGINKCTFVESTNVYTDTNTDTKPDTITILGVPPKKSASPKISKSEKLAKANEICLEKCLAELDEFPTAILEQLWKWKKSIDDHNSSMASRKITFSATALTQTLSQLANLKQSDAIRSITKAITKPEWGTIYTDNKQNYNANKKHDSAAYDMSDPAVLADLAATSARAKADKERLAKLLEDFNE